MIDFFFFFFPLKSLTVWCQFRVSVTSSSFKRPKSSTWTVPLPLVWHVSQVSAQLPADKLRLNDVVAVMKHSAERCRAPLSKQPKAFMPASVYCQRRRGINIHFGWSAVSASALCRAANVRRSDTSAATAGALIARLGSIRFLFMWIGAGLEHAVGQKSLGKEDFFFFLARLQSFFSQSPGLWDFIKNK